MSVRTFNGTTDKITLSLGATNFAFGPGSIAAVIRTPATFQAAFILAVGATAATGYALRINATGGVVLDTDNNTVTAGANLTASTQYLIAATKATGTVVGRIHIYDIAAKTWTHTNSGGTLANGTVPITRAAFGVNKGGTGTFWNGDIAAAGVWNVELSDTQIEALALFLPATTKGLWRLNQDATGTNVLDLSGGGANQSAITGTSVTAVTVPVGMMNLAPPKPVPLTPNTFASVRASNY